MSSYSIKGIHPANEAVLYSDVYLVLLHATRIPPHLLVSVNGKIFSLGVKGPMVDDELSSIVKLIKQRRVPTIFVRLSVPPLFTIDDLRKEIRKYILAYPRVDIGIATCLTPIRDFCGSVYHTETERVNFVYELLPKLFNQKAAGESYHLFMEPYLVEANFALPQYSMNDIYEGIRSVSVAG